MKGFKPTGYGPSAGFKFPQNMGFTGSTGAYTHVSPYVRRKFANGGSVRGSDPGGSTVNRAKTYAQWQTDTGSTSRLLPGYKDGGRNWIAGAIKKPGALHEALGVPMGKKIPAKKLTKAAHSDNPTMRRRANLAKTLKKMHKADGGYVDRSYRVPRRYTEYTMSEGVRAIPPLAKELMRSGVRSIKRGMGPRERTFGPKHRTEEEVMASNYRRGGKAKRMGYSEGGSKKRMGYADGGAAKQSNFDDWNDFYHRELSGGRYKTRKKLVEPPKAPPPKPATTTRGRFYAKGGGVSSAEAKEIAERTVGEHVRYPAPKGHKGLEKVMR